MQNCFFHTRPHAEKQHIQQCVCLQAKLPSFVL
uniref:Uncharacterized protein n=1 Tax=Anguilla anguilla TaxID=7936 RepID=A0A0E9QD56_ANGAN